MARNGPLVPLEVLAALMLLTLLILFVTGRPRVRSRWPSLFPEAVAFAMLALLHLLFFWQPYRSEALIPRGGGDMASFFYPIHAFAAGEVSSGNTPFWNPHLFSGAPHLANFQTAALYPLNRIAYFLSEPFSYAALERLTLLHYLIASVGVYWLARALSISRPGAVLAGAMFAYSGFMVAHLGHYSMLSTAAWAPWVFAAIVGSVRLRSWPIAIGGAVVLTMAILGGHQPILLMTLTFAALLALFELWRDAEYPALTDLWEEMRPRRFVVAAIRPLFMAVVGAMVAAPVLGPALQMTGYTVRGGLSYRAASEFSVEPVALLHMLLPTVFGSNPTDYWGHFSNTEIWGFAGVLGVGLAVLGFMLSAGRTRLFWAFGGLLGLLYLLGPFTPLHGWAYAFVPAFDQIRGAGRGYMFVNLAVAILAGFGLTALERNRAGWTERQELILRRFTIGIGAALVVVVAIFVPVFASNVLGSNDPGNRPIIAMNAVNMLALWLLLGLVVFYAIWRRALGREAIVLALSAVVLLEIFSVTAPFNPTTDPILSGFEHADTVTFLREQDADGPFRIEVTTSRWQPDLARIAGLEDIGGLFDPLALGNYDRFLHTAKLDRQSDAYQSLNVRYVISDPEIGSPGTGFEQVYESDTGLVVWGADEWRPRAWLEGSEDIPLVVESGAGEVEVKLPDGAPEAMLVISQTHFPGWRASVDGTDVAVRTYNEALQAVSLPAGASQVELTFRPENWTLWLAISSAGGAIWATMIAVVAVPRLQWLEDLIR